MTIKGVVPVGVDNIFQYFEKSKDETEKLIRFSSFDVSKGFLSHLIDWSKGFTEDTIYCVESYMNVFPFLSFLSTTLSFVALCHFNNTVSGVITVIH